MIKEFLAIREIMVHII